MITLNEIEKREAQLKEDLDTLMYTEFSTVIEKYCNNLNISITRIFPSKTIYCWEIHGEVVPIHMLIELDEKRIQFSINEGSPKMFMPLFSYNEMFKEQALYRRIDMMVRMVRAGVYYGCES